MLWLKLTLNGGKTSKSSIRLSKQLSKSMILNNIISKLLESEIIDSIAINRAERHDF